MLTVGVMLTVEVGLVPRKRAGVIAKPVVMLTVRAPSRSGRCWAR